MSWQIYDFSIVWGHRGKAEQNKAFEKGRSGKRWPDSLHNKNPSLALDFAPYIKGVGIPWDDKIAFALVAGLYMAAASELRIPIIYGGDWDGDGQTIDSRLLDLGHIQLEKP